MAKGQINIHQFVEQKVLNRYASEKGNEHTVTQDEKDFISLLMGVQVDSTESLAKMADLFPKVLNHRRSFIVVREEQNLAKLEEELARKREAYEKLQKSLK